MKYKNLLEASPYLAMGAAVGAGAFDLLSYAHDILKKLPCEPTQKTFLPQSRLPKPNHENDLVAESERLHGFKL